MAIVAAFIIGTMLVLGSSSQNPIFELFIKKNPNTKTLGERNYQLDDKYEFKDKYLEQLIKKGLEIEYRDIYYFDLLSITELTILGNHIWINNDDTEKYYAARIDKDGYSVQNYELEYHDFGINYNITDLSDLAALGNLNELIINCCNLSDLSSLSTINNLTLLDLQYNNISDINSLSNMNKLQSLNLKDNNISDLSPILELPSLSKLNILNNPTGKEDIPEIEKKNLDLFIH